MEQKCFTRTRIHAFCRRLLVERNLTFNDFQANDGTLWHHGTVYRRQHEMEQRAKKKKKNLDEDDNDYEITVMANV